MTNQSELLLGFDFGMKNIGIAIGQKISQTASPLTTIKARDGIPNWNEITSIVQQWSPQAFVIGIPLNMDDSKQPITYAAKRFANRLNARYNLPIHLVDERLTTWEAKQRIREQGKDPKDLSLLNATSAVILLEQWLKAN